MLLHCNLEKSLILRQLVCFYAHVLFQEIVMLIAYSSANLLSSLGLLVDALTGLERILTTPIPFSCEPSSHIVP
jgi:hypothetical protein